MNRGTPGTWRTFEGQGTREPYGTHGTDRKASLRTGSRRSVGRSRPPHPETTARHGRSATNQHTHQDR
ncbi:MAG TPA: hypothetical protein VIU15_08925, partial [Streptomyces sp.]